jgi:iron complex outermembrane receptor protein
VVQDEESWTEPTWRLNLGYQATDDLYLYGAYARGFKSGGYNDQTGTSGNPIQPIQARPTDPELADSFEIGLRSEVFDNRLRLNLTGFFVTYDDSQQQLLAKITADRDGDGIEESEFQETRYFNAAEIEVKGVELEAAWLINENFTISGSLGVLDAEFKSFEADTNFDGTIDTDLTGSPVARAPESTWNVDFLYNLPVGQGNLELALNVNYEDEAVYAYTSVGGTDNGVTDERTLVNAAATYTSPDGRWWLRLYGKNLTDERYRIGELPVANLWVMSFYGQPETIGLEGGVRLDW